MKKRSWYVILTVFLLAVILNIIAWNSSAFCDWYSVSIYPLWINLFGRFSSLFPFSFGEILIAAGVTWMIGSALLTLLAVILYGIKRKGTTTKFFVKLCKKNGTILLTAVVFFFLIQTTNCFILYHTSPFEEKYISLHKEEYTLEELITLRDSVVKKVNEMSKQMERNEDGTIIYNHNMESTAVECMKNLGEKYPQLQGYYPTPKKMRASEFVSQQKMQGYFFPFSMEANYNDIMHMMKKPATMCHELAHTKGFLSEDEANLIAFLACISSDDPVFQYSGYLSVLNYIDNDYYESIHKNREIYNTHVKISAQARKDNVFLTEEVKHEVEQKAVLKTEVVSEITESAISASLVANGIEEGSLNYGKVVGLLLGYYGGIYEDESNPGYLVQGEE